MSAIALETGQMGQDDTKFLLINGMFWDNFQRWKIIAGIYGTVLLAIIVITGLIWYPAMETVGYCLSLPSDTFSSSVSQPQPISTVSRMRSNHTTWPATHISLSSYTAASSPEIDPCEISTVNEQPPAIIRNIILVCGFVCPIISLTHLCYFIFNILYLVRPNSYRRISYHLRLTRTLREHYNMFRYDTFFVGSALFWSVINVIQFFEGIVAGDVLGFVFVMGCLVVSVLVSVIITLVICLPGRWLVQKLRHLVN